MTMRIQALSGADEKGKLNTEWLLLVNEGDRPFNATGCSITVSKGSGSRPRVVTTLKAGLILQPKEVVRLVTGSSGRSSHGNAPEEEGVRNFHLYLKAPYLERPKLVVRLMNRQQEICRAAYDPDKPDEQKPAQA